MEFLKNFLKNLAFLIVLGFVVFLIAPDFMRQVFAALGAILGPVALLVFLVAALPRKRRSRR